MPAAKFVMQEIVLVSILDTAANIASGIVDIPTASAPNFFAILISAGVS